MQLNFKVHCSQSTGRTYISADKASNTWDNAHIHSLSISLPLAKYPPKFLQQENEMFSSKSQSGPLSYLSWSMPPMIVPVKIKIKVMGTGAARQHRFDCHAISPTTKQQKELTNSLPCIFSPFHQPLLRPWTSELATLIKLLSSPCSRPFEIFWLVSTFCNSSFSSLVI